MAQQQLFLFFGAVHPENQTFFRFIWRRPGDPGPPIAYQMMVLIFGAGSSPTCAAFVLRYITRDHPQYADVAVLILTKFYVDNYLDSFETREEAITTCRRLRELLFGGTCLPAVRRRGVTSTTRWRSSKGGCLGNHQTSSRMWAGGRESNRR